MGAADDGSGNYRSEQEIERDIAAAKANEQANELARRHERRRTRWSEYARHAASYRCYASVAAAQADLLLKLEEERFGPLP